MPWNISPCGLGPDVAGLAADVALDGNRRQDEKRCRDKGRQRPADVDGERDDKERDQCDQVAPDPGDEKRPDPLHGGGVALHPLDQRARRVRLVERSVERQEMAEKIHLDRRGRAQTDAHEKRAVDDQRQRPDEEEREDRAPHPPDRRPVAGDEDAVEQGLQHPGECAEGGALDHHEERGQRHGPLVRRQIVAPEPGEEPAGTVGLCGGGGAFWGHGATGLRLARRGRRSGRSSPKASTEARQGDMAGGVDLPRPAAYALAT